MNLVVDLADVGLEQLATAGPKLARLGRLAARGVRVPDGYVVTAAALPAAARDAGDPERARARLAGEPLADELAAAIRDAHRRLEERSGRGGALRVAVRSSAAAEDGADASFAGQFDTFLGVRGADDVLVHVRRCWASLYSPRAVEYRRRQGLPAHGGDLAVGVLELVDARSSGVLFTVDPVTGDRGRMVIEASWGLGECVVSGRVTPDRWVADRAGAVRERHVSHKAAWSVLDEAAGGVVERPMPPDLADAPSLSDAEVAALCAQGTAIEAEEGVAQDVEWAIDAGGEVVILQHRPATAVASEPFDPVRYTLERVWKVP